MSASTGPNIGEFNAIWAPSNQPKRKAVNLAVESHRKEGAAIVVRCAVITISDTRTTETDKSGALMLSSLEAVGHQIVHYAIVPDEPNLIRPEIVALGDRDDCDAILLNGGTGIASRDRTYDVVADLLEKQLDGFGELFRMLSFEEIVAAAMLSRAVAGVYKNTFIVSTPGSSGAVRLAMDRLITPELGHIIQQIRA